MIRIGILGSDSSHAFAFATLCNIPDTHTGQYNFPDVRITAIYGHDKKQTEKTALDCKIEEIVSSPDELIGKVDAVMILFRDGNLHTSYAIPFIKAGIPVWIDKPLTVTLEDSKILLKEAEKHNCLITGGSTCKYSKDVLELKNIINNGSVGNVLAGYINFPGDINSPYNGIFFYGPHIVEMLFTIFGYKVKSLTTIKRDSNILCVADYDTYSVVLDFTKNLDHSLCVIHGDKKSHVGEIKIDSSTYKAGLDKFIEMLDTGIMPLSPDKLAASTKFLAAINESFETEKKVYLNLGY
ncbi:Gfo/Idh/MocA family oxidoreductase [Anaerocolumna aminovalerica]|uniref:Gfo/Idh/MocA family protein n=1 Tax=Anaerocolumna aminovalerica TaxID=1527 RepID=UPI001C0EE04C|nr:Gfo/Idh/MocA family oxidoreductase [Anaerocolumna aminovalerica]MBU5334043.1 Gfo/Idh/MocA family oxidoreductase [Anaerocolumna aminovalerica]